MVIRNEVIRLQLSRVISRKPLSFGIRLKELINESGFVTQKQFVESFAVWKSKKTEYGSIPDPEEKDISRWIKGVVKIPNKSKRIMFADFFDVDVEYLECTQLEKKKPKKSKKQINQDSIYDKWATKLSPDSIKSSENELKKSEHLIPFLEGLGYMVEFVPEDNEINEHIYEIIRDNEILTIQALSTYETDFSVDITYPNGTTKNLTYGSFEELINRIEKFIQFEFESI